MPVETLNNTLESLRERGRKQGFLTDRELAEALSSNKESLDVETIEAFMEEIEEAGVSVVAKAPAKRDTADEREPTPDELEPVSELEESTQAWLRRAGKVALLTHDQEITLARRM
ncbi:MAG: hypothetical protein JWN14_3819, partial [Chthonomonadales bacterium]|nr:hypothetical protein [Chthonomonadales bacterium]